MSVISEIPVSHNDPVNAQILAVSEDKISGFNRDPLRAISSQSGVPVETVIERIRAMLEAGTIRRVRQTLVANDLAPGALVAWEVPTERLDAAFDYLFQQDPFSGHVVIRSTDTETAGSQYKLWTTLKVPHGYSMHRHCTVLMEKIGALHYRLMPARAIFALGVGHVRRQKIEPGSRSETQAEMHEVQDVRLTEREWQALMELKRDFKPEELTLNLWAQRATSAGLPVEEFFAIAESLDRRGVVGRFSTFLEHVKPTSTGERVTRFNALFHWAVPPGQEIAAGREVGRHEIMTHAYWREGGPDFKNVNIMGVAHGTQKDLVRAHKAAIDEHLREAGIDFSYTNIFWGGRSEIKPSEIAPQAYREWCERSGIDPVRMQD